MDTLLESKDGFVRGCNVKVHNGKGGHIIMRRPVNQLCYFEVDNFGELNQTIPKNTAIVTQRETEDIPVSPKTSASKPTLRIANHKHHAVNKRVRPRRNAAVKGELIRRFNDKFSCDE